MDQEIIQKLTQLQNEGKLKWEWSYWKKEQFITTWNRDNLTCHLFQDLTIWLSECGDVNEVEYHYVNRWEDKYTIVTILAKGSQAGVELYKLAKAQCLARTEDQKQREKKQKKEKHEQKQASFLKKLEAL
jgi:hypothetical protein